MLCAFDIGDIICGGKLKQLNCESNKYALRLQPGYFKILYKLIFFHVSKNLLVKSQITTLNFIANFFVCLLVCVPSCIKRKQFPSKR